MADGGGYVAGQAGTVLDVTRFFTPVTWRARLGGQPLTAFGAGAGLHGQRKVRHRTYLPRGCA